MRAWLFPLCFAFAFGLVAPAPAQVPPEKAEATFTVAPELEFKLWASEPLFVNPTCIDIDHLGRLWVCESVNYRDTLHRRPLKRPEGDRILILEDSHGAGKADKVTVFYQAKEILAPLGIAVAKDPVGPGYKVYVCQSPDILLFEDKDGDGKADGPPWKLLTGFRGIDHDHGVHGILIGPDGKLYFSVGDQGVHDLQSSDGKGRKWSSNDTDCRAGTIWRCNLDGTGLELIAHNFRNEYEPCVDSFGNVFVSDNDDDGNQQTRICYVMRGGNYGYYPRGPGQSHWHEEQPGIVPKILRTGFGSPTGMCVYEGTLLPQKYWGQPLHTDAGPRHVRCYHLTPKGAGYDVEREDIVTSTDTWFRPSDICVAPDGSVFVADWYDPGVGGHGMGDTTRGRIYRLAPKGHKYHAPKVDLITKEGFLAALGSPNLAVRAMAILSVQRANAGANGDTTQWLDEALTQTRNPTLRARAAWLKFLPAGPGFEQELLALEKSGDPRFQILALRLLSQIGQRTNGGSRIDLGQSFLSALGATADPAVRAEALLLLAGQDPAKAKEPILKLAAGYDGKDRFYLEAVGIAVGHHDPNRREILLADFDQRFPDWNDKLANLIWELRPPAVLPRLEKLLTDGQTPVAQRRQIVEILAAASDGGAGETLLRVLRRPLPTEVRDRIVANFQQFLPGEMARASKPSGTGGNGRTAARERGRAGCGTPLDRRCRPGRSHPQSACLGRK